MVSEGKIEVPRKSLMMRAILAALLLLTAGKIPVVAAPADIPIHKGWRFVYARAALVADGWVPVRSTDPESKFIQSLPLGKEFPEVEFCSEGPMFCWFDYAKNGRCLRVETMGEFKMKVIYWENKCPDQR